MACGEFSLIARYFDRVKKRLALMLKPASAMTARSCNIPEKKTLAISTDTLVAGNHFLPDIDPADLAYKALAVNLSDLAAMGADPAWLTLALTLPEVDEVWLEAFSDSLFDPAGLLRYATDWRRHYPWPALHDAGYPRLCAAGTRHETRWREAGGLDLCYRHSGR